MKLRFSIIGALLCLAVATGFAADARDEARAHWAYQPVRRPALPTVKMTVWVKTPIDAFILARLEAKGLQPSPPASKETLLRRVTFDLIGLPPTTEELRAFLGDTSPNAFAKVVDQLLASPHFGERWGRHWLDTARYSDTAGRGQAALQSYRFAYAWGYRDYVINAFNQDKPYDRFIVEQLAADKLSLGEDKSALAALGFLTVGERFQNKNDIINDRIDTVTKAFLGLTVSCARCHDHKFDPIPTADYYSLHGIFNSSIESVDKPIVAAPKDKTLLADYAAKLRALEEQNLDAYYDEMDKIDGEFRRHAAGYLQFDEPSRGRQVAESSVRMMRDNQLGNDRLARIALQNARADDPVWGPWLSFSKLAADDFVARGAALANEIAGGKWNPIVAGQFRNAAPKSLADVAALYGAAFAQAEAQAQNYLAAKRRASTAEVPGFDPPLAQLIEQPLPILPGGTLTTERLRDAVLQWPRGFRSRPKFVFDAINELELTNPAAPAHAMVVEDSPNPTDSPIFIRGQAEVRGDVVPRRFLEILSGPQRPIYTQGSGRLELALAIASKSNPLTARVLVNRVWMHLFGAGFVTTPDDLGVQSEPPSHPELLDWLAGAFMEAGWSRKRLIRFIVLSNVYQQSSEENPQYSQIDPNNRLLWRANIRRLDFESIRDSLLVFSGKLDPTIGGKPINLTEEPYSYRRSVYGYVDRGNLPEIMQQFDFSDPDMTNSKRATTVVPQQALFFLNSPMVVDIARKMVARQEFTSAADDPSRIGALYSIIFQRAPRIEETKLGLAYLDDLKRTLASAPATVEAPQPRRRNVNNNPSDGHTAIQNQGEKVDRRPLTAWEQYAQALLFANEVIYVN
ncbi:MAG TPA: DUF1549 and DUF1553 domain-containing protein [Chthoniobacter sp.]|jgi:hypothetical protein